MYFSWMDKRKCIDFMHLKTLQLKNYRNYEELYLNLHPEMNILVGDNAQGKTNIIEAIYFLSIGKSHRNSKIKEIVKWGEKYTYLKGEVCTFSGENTIEIGLSSDNQGKKIKRNGVILQKTEELLGQIHTVLFSPEDLKIIKEGPVERRNFLDREISNMKPQYYHALLEYNKILRQRNHLLKKIYTNPKLKETLSLWDEQLIDVGIKIIKTRLHFLKKINLFSKKIHSEITDGLEDIELFYQSTVLSSKEDISAVQDLFKEKLEKNRSLDIKRGTTTIGPHRDDLKVNINKIDIRSYGSQGQQRTSALSLKLSIFELVYSEIGEYPILLLDDVMSELDINRQKKLMKAIKNVQTFITSTDLSFIDHFNRTKYKIIKVHRGKTQEDE